MSNEVDIHSPNLWQKPMYKAVKVPMARMMATMDFHSPVRAVNSEYVAQKLARYTEKRK